MPDGSRDRHPDRRQLRLFFAGAFGLAWLFWIPMALTKFHIISLSMLSLLFVERRTGNRTLVQAAFGGIRWRGSGKWITMAILAPPRIVVVANALQGVVNGFERVAVLRAEPLETLGYGLMLIIRIQFLASLISSPLGEEPGWRGFALSRLQGEYGRLPAVSSWVLHGGYGMCPCCLRLESGPHCTPMRPLWGTPCFLIGSGSAHGQSSACHARASGE